ncbi:MAG: hypothetical protein VKJ64_17175, partial [Leptolyngbyaceae bacterium]|nr:hypothetical protein [Leptolyngbyaceae bacterium]
VPVKSLTWNIGFGHPQSKTYKGKEQDWVNAKYEENFCPNQLPTSLDLLPQLARSLTDLELIQHFSKNKNIWLSPTAFWYFFNRYHTLSLKVATLRLFSQRLPKVLQRWRNKLPI